MQVELYRIPSSDIPDLLRKYDRVIYWTPAQQKFVEYVNGVYCRDVDCSSSPLEYLQQNNLDAPIVLSGVIDDEKIDPFVAHTIIDAYLREFPQHWVFVTYVKVAISSDLLPFVKETIWPLPTTKELADFLRSRQVYSDELVRAASGLYFGELKLMLATSQSESALDVVAEFKERRLRQKGILYVPKPDVEIAGIENIKISIDKAAAMLLPEAKEAKLPFPEGMVLIGPPGTGKSLAAKSAAKWMNVPLVCADWGNLIAPTPGQTEDNIRSLIELTESISPCILFFDDFDKAFASADLSRENATEKRVAGILLTWLQERTADVYVIVTCNRVLQIPPELLRRFSDIIFVDLPHEGSRFEIFKSHLNKHGADYTHWTDIQWKNIIKRYNECTPDEIGKAVNWAVTDRFRTDHTKNVIVEDLLKAREQFTPSNIANSMTGGGNVISDIRLFCMPYKKAASEDNSEFKITPVPEFVALGR